MLTGEALEQAIKSERSGRCDNVDSDGSCLLVTVGGLAGKGFYAGFEFTRSTEHLPVPKVYLRDRRQCWYLRGVDGLGDDLPTSAAELRALQERLGVPRMVLLGQSMGGFGAIALGCLAGADAVVAIAPQTTVRLDHRIRMADTRFRPELRRTNRLVRGMDPPRDLRPLLDGAPGTRISLHLDPADRADLRHAQHLADAPQVSITPWPGGGHLLARELVRSGALASILDEVVTA